MKVLTKKGIELCFNRFLVDARDDFYPDPIDYYDLQQVKEDIVDDVQKIIKSILKEYKEKSKIRKYPEKEAPCKWNVPKSNYVVRQALTFHPVDRIIYHFVLNRLMPEIEPAMSRARYSYKVMNIKSTKIFMYPVKSWVAFRKDIKRFFIDNPDYEYLVSTDIAGFYEYIHILDFKNQIKDLSGNKEEPVIEILRALLKCFSCSGEKDSGIPQNYDPSSYLCSAFLNFLDKELEAKGYTHFRYVDDIKVPCKNKNDAKKAIVDIVETLRQLNLNLSTAKTDIWHKSNAQFLEFTRDFPDIIERVDKAFSKRRKKDIQNLLPELVSTTKGVIRDSNGLDEKLFRACIWRIVKAHSFKNMQKPDIDYIGKKCLMMLDEKPQDTVMFLRFLELHKNRKYVQDRLFRILSESVYPWQQMKIWGLLTQADVIKNHDIISLAKKRMKSSGYPEEVRNFVILFLGKHGDYWDRRSIAQLINKPQPFLTKRCIVLALQQYRDRSTVYNAINAGHSDVILKSLTQYVKQLKAPHYINENKNIGSDFIS